MSFSEFGKYLFSSTSVVLYILFFFRAMTQTDFEKSTYLIEKKRGYTIYILSSESFHAVQIRAHEKENVTCVGQFFFENDIICVKNVLFRRIFLLEYFITCKNNRSEINYDNAKFVQFGAFVYDK
ncbi:hypothetical protein RFI_12913 [Reticulomyxa filosa]|uniref:Uncharacterized protein n=1 Tax=Reticulomyxa filosa TaxID=46433 RepID=X6NE40_RETFI|nr:hypothetical protein RFI_12913 [Reticulomyxa filosa]|eukprot:ETO24246.1 hypothetical protein RFI_12913 [Reticulomyxa filosa]